MKKPLLLAFVCTFSLFSFSQINIFPYNSSWKYLDNGSNQGTAWRAAAFNDAGWPNGNAQLGYGDGDEATIVSYGANANAKYITTYFRKSVSIANPAAYSSFTANVKRDDGVVIYVNGTEVYRNNMPTGTISYTSLASSAASDDGNTPQTVSIPTARFTAGNNVIAVEMHQNAANSSDLSFDMELYGIPAPVITTLMNYGSSWKYLANGSNQGTAWRASNFNDGSWPTGNAELGYGDGDEATVVSYGPNANNKYITTYFRKSISIPDTSVYSGYTLYIKRDDGAVVYINGTEVYRTNMPTGTIGYTTRASSAASDDGETPQTRTLTISQLRQGTNIIAVEMHQNTPSSTDLSFDMELTGTGGSGGGSIASLSRGPYLNMALQNSIVIRWRTNIATNSKVSFGTSPGNLNQSVTDNTSTTEHIITLTGLSPNTQYYYNIGSTTQTLQGDAANYFKTMPDAGSTQKIRFLVMGDMGNNSTTQVNVRNAWINFNGSNYTDGWLLLGDNAYPNGTDAEYQTGFWNIYQNTISKNHPLWPAPGNHDYANSSARQADHNIAYYPMFSLPSNGEAGGVASGTEAYYSWNYGNVHFVSLDSYGWETGNTRLYDTLGPQAVWLKQDLAANTQPWTIVYFHHPPYTKGSHNSDTETELIRMRENMVRIFERYNVDLVLSGHSHSYERSFLINGHYGLETTFNASSHALSSSSAKYDGSSNSCIYVKRNNDARNGIVFAVAGSSGQLDNTTASGYPHNAMYYSNVSFGGALYLEIENNRLNAKWVCTDGVVRDNFTIMKNVGTSSSININAGETVDLSASWVGNYTWSTGSLLQSIQVTPLVSTIYTVTDNLNCITDTFNVVVNSPLRATSPIIQEPVKETKSLFRMYPTVLKRGQLLTVQNGKPGLVWYRIMDVNGRLVEEFAVTGSSQVSTDRLSPGLYFLNEKMGKDGGKLIVIE